MLDVIVCGGPSDSWEEDLAPKLDSSDRCLFLKKPLDPLFTLRFTLFLAQKSRAALHSLAQSDSLLAAAEAARRAAQEQCRLLFDNNPIPIYACDQTTFAFLAVNQAAVQLYGYSRDEFLAMTLLDLALPQDIPAFRQRLSKLAPCAGNSGVWRHRVHDGKYLEVEITSHGLALEARQAWLSMVMDVTGRTRLEAHLRQTQKMESVEQMAGGIAHDFNNLLTVISGHAGILMAGPPSSPKAADSLKEISQATKRASDLTRQLMSLTPAWHEQSVPPPMPSGEQKVIGGAETILLVEDEAPLLKLMHHILESYGYKVLDSSTGSAALEIWAQQKEKIDLLLSDLILPDGMGGRELAKILQAERPGLKVIYTSGYDSERLPGGFLPAQGAVFIQKPFHARKLAETVFDTLREKQSTVT
jgi:PAS domain S-box-containing protein